MQWLPHAELLILCSTYNSVFHPLRPYIQLLHVLHILSSISGQDVITPPKIATVIILVLNQIAL